LVDLLLDLVDGMLLAVDPQRQLRHAVALGRADGQALDVVAAPVEHHRHPDEGARLVLEQDGERVDHSVGTAWVRPSSYSSRSIGDAPAGIIGNTCSSESTWASITVVRPDASASSSAASSAGSVSTVKPAAP